MQLMHPILRDTLQMIGQAQGSNKGRRTVPVVTAQSMRHRFTMPVFNESDAHGS